MGATACLIGGYVGVDEGLYAHRYTYLYDEYEVNLGYPLSAAQAIQSGVFLRYFDNGVVIVNGSGSNVTVSAGQLSGGPYYRFKGGQQPSFNTGASFTSVDLQGSGGQTQNQTGDGIVLLLQQDTLITDIIIDNKDINMTSPGSDPVSYTGSWTQQAMANLTYTNAYSLSYGWDEYAAPYAYASAGNGNAQALYIPTIGVSGEYDIYEWHPFHGSTAGESQEATAVPYSITHRDGVKILTVDQSQNTGQWNYLGRYYFQEGRVGNVTLSNQVSSGIVLSDAIKFVWTGGGGAIQDTVMPFITKVRVPAPTEVEIFFNEILDSASIGNVNNYSINNNIGLPSLAILVNGATVKLTVNSLTQNQTYILTVNNVRDLAGNQIADGSSSIFYYAVENLPLDFMNTPVGTEKKVVIPLLNVSQFPFAALVITATDVDAFEEVEMFINQRGAVSLPSGVIKLDGGTLIDSLILPTSYFSEGENTLTFRFASDLNGTTKGFVIEDIQIHLTQTNAGIGRSEGLFKDPDHLQIYPNPFRSFTVINMGAVPQDKRVFIFNVKGERVEEFSNIKNPWVVWRSQKQSAGIYFVIMKMNNKIQQKQILLIK